MWSLSPSQPSPTALEYFSLVLGWTYTLLWSLSFYPQVIMNFQRKSISGFSQDFAHLNVVGFLSYTVFNLSFLYSAEVQKEYRERHQGNTNVVRWNDAVFATNAFVLAAIQLAQSYWYSPVGKQASEGVTTTSAGADGGESQRGGGYGGSDSAASRGRPTQQQQQERYDEEHSVLRGWLHFGIRGNERLSPFAILSLLSIFLLVSATLVASLAPSHPFGLYPLDFVNLLTSVKLYITLVKYFPQMSLNYRRKSTKGFSITNILLDFSGGLLSLAQLVLDAAFIHHDWSAVTGDFGKL